MNVFLSPLVAFVVLLCLVYLFYRFGIPSSRGRWLRRVGKSQVYACGEDYKGFQPQISYRQFFVFAMFFTIIHVAALVLGTVADGIVGLSVTYIVTLSLGLIILVRG